MKLMIATVVGAVLLVGGCGGGTTGAAGPATGSPERTVPQSSGGTGGDVPEALRFEGETLDGRAFDGASLAGRPVVFWFWAPWCPKCISEGPDVAKAAGKYGDRVSFVGVGGLEKEQARLREFVSRTGTGGLTHLDDRTGGLYSHFKVTSQSSFVFMAPDGTRSKESGPLGESELNRHVDELLG